MKRCGITNHVTFLHKSKDSQAEHLIVYLQWKLQIFFKESDNFVQINALRFRSR